LLTPGRAYLGLRNLANRHVLGIPPRSENPYATHLPVLLAVAQQRKVRRILELGSGMHSTLTFLDRNYFPDVERVDAIENDASWAEKVKAAAGDDPRLALRTVCGAVCDVVDTLDAGTYDLALVDDSTTSHERTATLRRIAAQHPKSTLVVVHDFEVPEYRRVAEGFVHRVRITSLNPNVGLLWNDAMPRRGWRKFNAWLARHRDRVQPDDRAGWRRLIEQEAMGFLRSGSK
jgi:predicted O-methyltransferase YrrM